METTALSTDLRTKAGRRREILEQVREFGGFSIFWITANHLRAIVGTEMTASGELVDADKEKRFPWIPIRLADKEKEAAT